MRKKFRPSRSTSTMLGEVEDEEKGKRRGERNNEKEQTKEVNGTIVEFEPSSKDQSSIPHFDEIFGHLPGEGPGDMIPGEGDVGSDGQAKEGADGQEHGVGGDEGEDEDAERGEDEGAVHHKQRVHKCKIGKPPQHSISSSLQNKRHDN